MKIVVWLGRTWEAFDPDDILDRGLGGSETAACRMSRELVKLGHDVTVAGSFREERTWCGAKFVHYERVLKNEKTECDVFVSVRHIDGIDAAEECTTAKLKVLWVHDIHSGPDVRGWLSRYDIVFALTEWHKDELQVFYPHLDRDKIVVTRNGIDSELFGAGDELWEVKKAANRMVYASSPDRGLDRLLGYLPEIRKKVPDAELHVYYGFDTWELIAEKRNDPFAKAKIAYFKAMLAMTDGVVFHGRTGQRELAKEFLKAKIWSYPTGFTETSCITSMEAQAAGCVPICTHLAALGETVKWGIKIPESDLDKKFVRTCVSFLKEEGTGAREVIAHAARSYAMSYCDWSRVAADWVVTLAFALSKTRTVQHGPPGYVEPTEAEAEIDSLIVVVTSERPNGVTYVDETVRRLNEAGAQLASKRVVLFDGKVTRAFRGGWESRSVNDHGLQGGNTGAIWKAVALGDEMGARRVLVIEDDVLPCQGAIERALKMPIENDLAAVTFFDAVNVPPGSKFGLWKVGARAYSGNLCVLFPRRTARWVRLTDTISGAWHRNDGDNFLARVMSRSPWPKVGVHVPNLVEHIGDVSSIYTDGKVRKSSNFPGADFNAGELKW